jgi:hypothetical protein
MAKDSGLFFEASVPHLVSMRKSAGPATVLLVALRRGNLSKVKKIVGRKSVRKVGALWKR